MDLTALLCKVASANLGKDFTGKYYLALGFEDDDNLSRKHITVVYFAEQPPEALQDITRIIDDYINKNGFKSFEIDFDKVEMFGPEKDIKVVRPGTPKDSSELYLPELKKALYKYNKSSFKDAPYKPHVTTDNDREVGKVNRLVLASGDKVLKVWRASETEKTAQKAEYGSGNLDHDFGKTHSQDTNENATPWDLSQGKSYRIPDSFKRGFTKKAAKLKWALFPTKNS